MAFTFPKPIELIPQGTKIPFVSYFHFFFWLSTGLNLLTIVLLATIGLNLGIDFRGGTLVEIRTQQTADIAAIRSSLSGVSVGEIQIQEFGGPQDVLIRIPEQPGGEKAQQEVVQKVTAALGQGVEVRRTEVV